MTDAKRESGYMTEEYTQTSNPRVRVSQGFYYYGRYVREATSDEKLLWAEIERLRTALDDVVYHCGDCESERTNCIWTVAMNALHPAPPDETDETLLPSEVIGDPL